MRIDIESSKPLYPINVAADILGVSARMLREYEKAGFIKPARVNSKRRFSNNDLQFIKNVRFYLEEVGMTITGLKLLYMMAPCWEIKQCGMEECPAYGNCRSKCWDVIRRSKSCDGRSCEGCPIYLVQQKNMGMKIHQGKDIMPRCFLK